MVYTKLIPHRTQEARVEEISRDSSHHLLSIPAGTANQYRLAQLDDYTKLKRANFPHCSPIRLSLAARTSSSSIPGTWGFGLWNDPFGMSLGFGGSPWRLPALPNAVWFFGASEESFLSFKANRASSTPTTMGNSAPSTGSPQREIPANGFLAQAFRSPKFHPKLIPAGLALPLSRKVTRRLLGKTIDEDGIRLSVDSTQWHRYTLDWRENEVLFTVDDALVYESQVRPNPPLGLVIWIDNQFAAFTPEGRIGFGVLENPEAAWLEIKNVKIEL